MKYEVRSFDSKRKDQKPYVVECHDQGKYWTCTCPHWLFRLSKSGVHCKHIDKVIEENKRNEAAQAEIAKNFEKGMGIDWEDPPVPDDEEDIKVSPAI